MKRRVNPFLFASTPQSVSRVRLAERLMPGTVITYPGGERYAKHERGALQPARGVVFQALPGEWALAVLRDATLIGPLLNEGKGVDAQACVELRAAGITVLM